MLYYEIHSRWIQSSGYPSVPWHLPCWTFYRVLHYSVSTASADHPSLFSLYYTSGSRTEFNSADAPPQMSATPNVTLGETAPWIEDFTALARVFSGCA
jgi:hypothetical protein